MGRLGMLLALLFAGGLFWLALRAGGTGADAVVATGTEALRGLALARDKGCVACHSLDGAPSIGPSWLGGYGAQRQFTDGTAALADAAYLREAIQQPAARVVAGYDNLMLPAMLTDDEVDALIALLKELGTADLVGKE